MKLNKPILLFFLFFCANLVHAEKFTISGVVQDSLTLEPLVGVSITTSGNQHFAATNSMGFFSLTIEAATYSFNISCIGFKSIERQIILNENTRVDFLMSQEIYFIDTISISGAVFRKESEVIQTSSINIPVKQLKAIPSILGESDPLKIAQMLPGVQSGGEATPGLFIRGSASDQNLVLIDDAPIYNPFHLFGIFSVINSDALKSFEITKAGFSSQYGGRLASVVNMNLKEGNKNHFSGDFNLGLAASKVLLETPIVKNKISLMVSGRTTYAHLLAKPFMSKDQFGSYYFYDLNGKISAQLSAKTKLFLSLLYSGDQFTITDESVYYSKYYANVKWRNIVSSLRINKIINNKLFWNASMLYSKYNLTTAVTQKSTVDFYNLQYKTNIEDVAFKNDFSFYINSNNTFLFGMMTSLKTFVPDAVVAKNAYASSINRVVQKYETLESALYTEDELKIGKKINLRFGGRLNIYNYKAIMFLNPEPRISFSYNFFNNWAFKSSYTQMHQYMHLLTTKGVGLPTDLWVPVTNKVPYKEANQYTIAIVKDFPKQKITMTIEGYYKKTTNEISFKEGVSFMQTNNIQTVNQSDLSWEKNITNGSSWAYGAEFLLHKKAGRLQGWMGYTLSWSLSQYKDLNLGRKFFNRYDRRHNFTTTIIYQLTPKISLTASWIYMTGNPITVANSSLNFAELSPQNLAIPVTYTLGAFEYSGINNFRMPAYHRLDIGINYKTKGKKFNKELEFSIYNVYNRQNPYFYYIQSAPAGSNQSSSIKQVSVLPIMPSLNYKFIF